MTNADNDRRDALDAEADRRRAAIDKDVRTATEIVRLQEKIAGHTDLNKVRFDQIDKAVEEVKADVQEIKVETHREIGAVRTEVNGKLEQHEEDEKPYWEKLDTVRRLSWMGLMLILVLAAMIPLGLYVIDKALYPAPPVKAGK